MSLGPKSNFIPVIYAGTNKKNKNAKGKSKSKVDPAIFRMAEERDY
jgi:hypothetical protein